MATWYSVLVRQQNLNRFPGLICAPLAPTVYDNINILGCSGDDDLEKGMLRINWVMQIVEKKTQTDRISADRVAEEIRSALIR